MSNNRNEKSGPAHMASSRGKREEKSLSRRPSAQAGARRRREPLRDNYTYEQSKNGAQEFEDVASYSSSRKKREDQKELERQKGKRMSRGKKAAIIIVVVLLALIGGGAYYVFGYMLKDLTIAPITKDRDQLGINSKVQTDTSIKNIALFGLDARDDEFTGRSDAIIILTVDNKHGKIKMASVLRDSNVSMKRENEDGSTYYMDDKITHAYYYGGPELAVQTLNRNFSLDIEDYVTVNFIKMAEIIDACGGVKINISYDEMNEINTNLGLQVNESSDASIQSSDYLYEDGDVLLNGNQAVAYARIRYLDSDDVRASRQQTVLKALLEQARGKSKLEYPELIRKLMPMCKTSLDFSDIVAMVPIMLTNFTIETISIPGEEEAASGGINSQGGWVYLYDLEKAAKHINKFIYEEDASSEVRLDDDVKRVAEIAITGGYSSDDPYNSDEDIYAAEWTSPESYSEPSSSSSSSSEVSGGGSESSAVSSGEEDPGEGGDSSSSLSSSLEGGESESSSDPGYEPSGGEENPDNNSGGGEGENPGEYAESGGGESLDDGTVEGTGTVTP